MISAGYCLLCTQVKASQCNLYLMWLNTWCQSSCCRVCAQTRSFILPTTHSE